MARLIETWFNSKTGSNERKVIGLYFDADSISTRCRNRIRVEIESIWRTLFRQYPIACSCTGKCLCRTRVFAVIIPGNSKYVLREFNRVHDCLTGECNQVYLVSQLIMYLSWGIRDRLALSLAS